MARESQRDRFLDALTRLGGSAGNGKLQAELGWQKATYARVQAALIEEGAIVKGQGRGGSVSLVGTPDLQIVPEEPAPPAPTPAARPRANGNGKGGDLGFEAELFRAADKLRGNMEPSDYKHVALGLIFLKHISDSLR